VVIPGTRSCVHIAPFPPCFVYVSILPYRRTRVRDLDDLSASLEGLRRYIPEVFGNDAPQAEQQRRLVDLVSFICSRCLPLESLTIVSGVGRRKDSDPIKLPSSRSLQPSWCLTRSSSNATRQSERNGNVTEGTAEDDDQPRTEVAAAILSASIATLAGEPSGPQSADDDERGARVAVRATEPSCEAFDSRQIPRYFQATSP